MTQVIPWPFSHVVVWHHIPWISFGWNSSKFSSAGTCYQQPNHQKAGLMPYNPSWVGPCLVVCGKQSQWYTQYLIIPPFQHSENGITPTFSIQLQYQVQNQNHPVELLKNSTLLVLLSHHEILGHKVHSKFIIVSTYRKWYYQMDVWIQRYDHCLQTVVLT